MFPKIPEGYRVVPPYSFEATPKLSMCAHCEDHAAGIYPVGASANETIYLMF